MDDITEGLSSFFFLFHSMIVMNFPTVSSVSGSHQCQQDMKYATSLLLLKSMCVITCKHICNVHTHTAPDSVGNERHCEGFNMQKGKEMKTVQVAGMEIEYGTDWETGRI